MNDYDDLGEYNGNPVHDTWVDYDRKMYLDDTAPESVPRPRYESMPSNFRPNRKTISQNDIGGDELTTREKVYAILSILGLFVLAGLIGMLAALYL